MIDETEKKIRLAEETRRLVNHHLIKYAFTAIRDDCYLGIERSDGNDIEKREDYYFLLKAITKLEEKFSKIIRQGKAAKAEIENSSNIKRIIRD